MTDHIKNSTDSHNIKIQLRHRKDIRDIEQDLIKGKPYRELSEKYNVSITGLSKYKRKYLAKKTNIYQSKADIREGKFLYETLERYINNVNNIAESCVNTLQDPENSGKIDTSPQAHDVRITYKDKDGHKHKDTLQNILDDNDIDAMRVEIYTPDRVKTLLEASHVMNKHLHLLADIKGMIGNTTINLANQPMFLEFVQTVVRLLDPHPEIKAQLVAEIRKLSKTPLLDVTSTGETEKSV